MENVSGTVIEHEDDDAFHRLDGPITISGSGLFAWWVDYMMHRLDGPAGIFVDGAVVWRVFDEDVEPIPPLKRKSRTN